MQSSTIRSHRFMPRTHRVLLSLSLIRCCQLGQLGQQPHDQRCPSSQDAGIRAGGGRFQGTQSGAGGANLIRRRSSSLNVLHQATLCFSPVTLGRT
jgi:hypothetical protein